MTELSNSSRLYNVIWADDEIRDMIRGEEERELLRSYDLDIIAEAKTGDELSEALRRYVNNVDAIIVDANFGNYDNKELKENQIGGLRCAMQEYKRYNKQENRHIPFIVYTQRAPAILLNTLDIDERNKFVELFEQTGRWLMKSKDSWEVLAKVIKRSVEEETNPRAQIRKQHPEVFKHAKLIPGAEDLIIEGFLPSQTQKMEYAFNPIRLKWENIQKQCKRLGILPHIQHLNTMVDFLEGKEVDGYQLLEPIMEKPIIRSLKYILDLTQDGSHDSDGLKLDVVEYETKTQDKELYQSVLTALMNLIKWFGQQLEIPNPKNRWRTNYELEGCLTSTLVEITTTDGAKRKIPLFNLKNYMLLPRKDSNGKNIRFNEGDYVGLTKLDQALENKNPYQTKDNIKVDKAIRTYEILEKAEDEKSAE